MKQIFLFGLLLGILLDARAQEPCGIRMDQTVEGLPPRLRPPGMDPGVIPDSLSFSRMLDEWLETCQDAGYLEARIDSVRWDSICPSASLFAGPRYRWGMLEIRPGDEGIFRRAGIRPRTWDNKPVKITSWIRTNEKLLRYLENNGYPFARARMEGTRFRGTVVHARWAVEPGMQVFFDSLVVQGSLRVAPGVMNRQLGILAGQLFSARLLDQIPGNLAEWPFAREIRSHALEFRPGKADVYVYADRVPASRFNGILGLVQEEAGGGLRLTGELDLDLWNSFSRAERIRLRWRSPGKLSQDLRLQTSWPNLFSGPLGLDARFALYRKDTTYLSLNLQAGLAFRSVTGNNFSFFYEILDSDPVAGPVVGAVPRVRHSLYGFGYSRSRLDRPLNPSSGYRVQLEASLGNRRLEGAGEGEDGNYFSLGGEWLAESYLRLKGPLVGVLIQRAAYRNAFRNGVAAPGGFENEMFRLGGYGSIRGFGEDELLGSRYAFLSVEMRYLFGEYSNLHVFTEGGYLGRYGEGNWDHDLPWSFGAGMSLGTGAGIFSLTWALGTRQGNPLRLPDSRIHLGYQSLF